MVFNATFNNISVISWQSVLLMEETGGPGKNHWSVASHWHSYDHDGPNYNSTWRIYDSHNISGCIGSFKSNYHTVTTTTDPIVIVPDEYMTCLDLEVIVLMSEKASGVKCWQFLWWQLFFNSLICICVLPVYSTCFSRFLKVITVVYFLWQCW